MNSFYLQADRGLITLINSACDIIKDDNVIHIKTSAGMFNITQTFKITKILEINYISYYSTAY